MRKVKTSLADYLGNPSMSLQEVAVTMGCTKENIRQIEVKALRKLLRKLRARNVFCTADICGDAPLAERDEYHVNSAR